MSRTYTTFWRRQLVGSLACVQADQRPNRIGAMKPGTFLSEEAM